MVAGRVVDKAFGSLGYKSDPKGEVRAGADIKLKSGGAA